VGARTQVAERLYQNSAHSDKQPNLNLCQKFGATPLRAIRSPSTKLGGHPGGLNRQYTHKISLVHNPANDNFNLYYCAVGKEGTPGSKECCIGLLTSRRCR
jgi:hypothetical protein